MAKEKERPNVRVWTPLMAKLAVDIDEIKKSLLEAMHQGLTEEQLVEWLSRELFSSHEDGKVILTLFWIAQHRAEGFDP